jgi:hypothetical protein
MVSRVEQKQTRIELRREAPQLACWVSKTSDSHVSNKEVEKV